MSPTTLYEGPKPQGPPGPTGLPKMFHKGRRTDRPKTSPVLLVGGLLVAAGLAGYLLLRAHPDLPINEQLSTAVAAIQASLDALKQRVQLPSMVRATLAQHPDTPTGPAVAPQAHHVAPGAKPSAKPVAGKPQKKDARAAPPVELRNQATLFLANGERVTGELISETPEQVVLRWEFGDATFKRSEIVHFIPPKSDSVLPAGNSGKLVTVTLANGRTINGEILYDLPDEIVLSFEGGEITFRRSEIASIAPADPLAP